MSDEKTKVSKAPKKFTLSEPITLGEKTWTEVTIRKPTMADVEAADVVQNQEKSEVAANIELTARLTGLPTKVVRAMDPDDFVDIQGQIRLFSSKSQATGGDTPPT